MKIEMDDDAVIAHSHWHRRSLRLVAVAVAISVGGGFASCGGSDRGEQARRAVTATFAFTRGDAVWVVDANWRERRVAAGGGADFSPEGTELAFWTGRGLVVHDLATGTSEQVLPARTGGVNWPLYVRWAPRGERVATWYPRRIDVEGFTFLEPTLALIDVERGRRVDVPWAASTTDFGFDWSPDGKQLVFGECNQVGPAAHQEFNCDVVTVAADTQKRRLLRRGVSEFEPSWSPDGGAIALETSEHPTPRGDWIEGTEGLHVIEVATRRLRQVARGAVAGFAWSADSASIAYTSAADPNSIRLVARDGSRDRVLTRAKDVRFFELAWAPDGALIAAQAAGSDYEPRGVYVIDARTGKLVRHIVGGRVEFARWSRRP